MPDFELEKNLLPKISCGVDEAGRGPLAGPVVAAAVILDEANIPAKLDDSKKLTEKTRFDIFAEILATSYVSFAVVSSFVIDEINIRQASLLAMCRAVRQLEVLPDFALIDGNALPDNMPCESEAIVKGDSKSFSIAAASIVAKVVRDKIMARAHLLYPQFDFASHKGYGTKKHKKMLEKFSPCAIHRLTFSPVREATHKGN